MTTNSRFGKLLKHLIEAIDPFARNIFLMLRQNILYCLGFRREESSSNSVVIFLCSILTISLSLLANYFRAPEFTFFVISALNIDPFTQTWVNIKRFLNVYTVILSSLTIFKRVYISLNFSVSFLIRCKFTM